MVRPCSTRRPVILLSTLLVVCFALLQCAPPINAAPARPKPPTKAQLKAEIAKLSRNITLYFPGYAKYAKQLGQNINLALNTKYDFSALGHATLLIPNNAAADLLIKKIPLKPSNVAKGYNVTAYSIVSTRYLIPQMRSMAGGQKVGTQLRQPLFKMTARNAQLVAFGNSRKALRSMWSFIRTPRLYAGPYFIAHGVDNV